MAFRFNGNHQREPRRTVGFVVALIVMMVVSGCGHTGQGSIIGAWKSSAGQSPGSFTLFQFNADGTYGETRHIQMGHFGANEITSGTYSVSGTMLSLVPKQMTTRLDSPTALAMNKLLKPVGTAANTVNQPVQRTGTQIQQFSVSGDTLGLSSVGSNQPVTFERTSVPSASGS